MSYEASSERNYKHRALAITRPLWNFTGEYLCNVQTYESNDKRSRKIQFIRKYRFNHFFASISIKFFYKEYLFMMTNIYLIKAESTSGYIK